MDINSLILLGASTKRGDTKKIGMFGSGNKYALAYLLKNNYEIQIYSGLTPINITLREEILGDNKFDAININGKQTSITTEFGKDWKLWQSIREIYCNAIDEGLHKMEYVFKAEPKENETHFYIKSRNEIISFVSEFDNYFSENKKVVFSGEMGKILEKGTNPKLCLYRKGIKCFEANVNSIYDYDLNEITIDENRLVRYSFEVSSLIWNLIYSCDNKEVIKNILFQCGDSQFVEHIQGDYSSVSSSYMSKEYVEVLNELTIAPCGLSGLLSTEELGNTTILPNKIFQQAKSILTNDNLATKFKVYKNGFYVELIPSPLAESTMKEACLFFKECYQDVLSYPIKLARFEDKKVLGFADQQNNIIFISEICVDSGVQSVIETMIEEYIHLKYSVKDETRSFQDAAIKEIVKVLKVKNAYVL